MNKKQIIIIFFLGILISCSSIRTFREEATITNVIEVTTRDRFFDDYTNNGKLTVITGSQKLYNDLISDKKALFEIDTTRTKGKKYIRIEDYIKTQSSVRLQLGCYNFEQPYSLLYSVFYNRKGEEYELNKKTSPFIDTIWTNK